MAALHDLLDGLRGVCFPFGGVVAPPGFLMCSGQAVSRTDYAALYSLLGTRFGAGNGSTTFNVPDLRGRVPVGLDNMGGTNANRVTEAASGIDSLTIGATGGAQTHTLTTAQMPAHTHSYNAYTGANAGAGTPVTGTGATAVIGSSTSGSQGSGQAHNNMQPSMMMNWIIKT
ncbi:phage tail protein [Geminicoccus flavidas]|uniref:phage tail protein n=1 Tax=Geminicoccus flavidas TaxID=2506407 RepID=UPI00190F5FEB|nr:tail fiber protein [Geminicoccus flavidas]